MKGMHPIAAHSVHYRALVLDNNENDVAHLRYLLNRHPAISVIGEAVNLSQALEIILQQRVNLLFLESKLSGVGLLDECSRIPSAVKLVFHTTDKSAAAQAFDLDAVDFLMKPLSAARLAETVKRLFRKEMLKSSVLNHSPLRDCQMLIPFERGRRGATLDEISLIQAFGNYTRVLLGGGKSEIVLRSLVKWQQLLPAPPFLRVHRNTIVQINQVRGLEEVGNGSVLCIEKSSERIPVSRRCLPKVRQALFANAA